MGQRMNKRIIWSIILVPLLVISLVFPLGCKESEPKMTAPEVCQYVNQALPNEYNYLNSTSRYEISYTAVKARYAEPETLFAEGVWCVSVEVTTEPQQLINGQWVFTGASGSVDTVLAPYLFSEETGEVTYAPNIFEP